MGSTRIVVLANSIKLGGRCVAGREFWTGSGASFGDWIRPISDKPHGELDPPHMHMQDGRSLVVLDVVDVPLTRYANDPVHPEDWVIDVSTPWKRRGRFNAEQLAELEEKPRNLWLESAQRPDRASPAFMRATPNHRSLYLVRPMDFEVRAWVEQNVETHEVKRKSRAHFIYNGQEYQFGFTDPEFTNRHLKVFPALGAPPMIVRPPYRDRCLICVSLTPLFNGFHYKVVATVLELK